MRYSLRVLLVVFAIAPLILAWVLAPYFRPPRPRTLLVGKLDFQEGYVGPHTISYIISYEGGRTCFIDEAPYGSLDRATKESPGFVRSYYNETRNPRMRHQPDRFTTPEMEQQFEAVQRFVRGKIDSPGMSIADYLELHGNRVHMVLGKNDLSEISHQITAPTDKSVN